MIGRELLDETDGRRVKPLPRVERMELGSDIEPESEPEDLAPLETCADLLRRSSFAEREVFAHHLAERPVGDSCAVGEAPAGATRRSRAPPSPARPRARARGATFRRPAHRRWSRGAGRTALRPAGTSRAGARARCRGRRRRGEGRSHRPVAASSATHARRRTPPRRPTCPSPRPCAEPRRRTLPQRPRLSAHP